MQTREIPIEGMTCHHCAMTVRKELEKIAGVQVHDVKIGSATITFDEAEIPLTRIAETIQNAGYSPLV